MDAATALWIASGLGVALTALAKWAWDTTHDEIKKIRQLAEGKASMDEVNRLRDTQSSIFSIIREHEAEDRSRHGQLIDRINEGHEKILEKLEKLSDRRERGR